jgi:hypothetical protein
MVSDGEQRRGDGEGRPKIITLGFWAMGERGEQGTEMRSFKPAVM